LNNREVTLDQTVDPLIDAHIQSTLVQCAEESSVSMTGTTIMTNSNISSLSSSKTASSSKSNKTNSSGDTMQNQNSTSIGIKWKTPVKGSLSPQQARSIQKNLLKNHRRQINDKKKHHNFRH
jgi:hypothetical protein